MMPNISNGSTFGGIVNYANDIKDKGTTILAARGVDLTNNYTITQSFKVQAQMNRRVENCVGHFSLSFPPQDAHRCTDGFMRKLALEYMAKMGIRNTQFVIFRHHDHDHDHVHVVYNRVDDTGHTISDGCDVERAIAICQAMTRHYGLHWSDGKMNVNRNKLKGKAKVKYAIYDAAQLALAGSHTWDDFIRLMEKQGIQVKIAPLDNGKGLGITYVKGKVSMSGTQVDRRTLTFGMLNRQLGGITYVLPSELQEAIEEERINRLINVIDVKPRQTDVSFDKSDEYVDDNTIDFFEEGSDTDFFDSSLAANVASAAVDLMVGPSVAPSVGGGGGGGGSCHDDDDEDEENDRKKRRRFHR